MKAAVDRWRGPLTLVLALLVIVQLVAASIFAGTFDRKEYSQWPLSIAVVGDSFAAGSLNRVVWPTLLAQRTGWSVSNFALPGAGFAADGRGGYAFTYQVDRAQAAHPQVILIATGSADNGLPYMDTVKVGAVDALNKIKLGGQQALVIGPTWYELPVPRSVTRVSEAVQSVADSVDVPFLDAIDPPWLTPDDMQPDFSGPTDAGQSVIADKVAAWLRSTVMAE